MEEKKLKIQAKKLAKRKNRIKVNKRRMNSLLNAESRVKSSSAVSSEMNSLMSPSSAWFEEASDVMIETSDLFREKRTSDEKHSRSKC